MKFELVDGSYIEIKMIEGWMFNYVHPYENVIIVIDKGRIESKKIIEEYIGEYRYRKIEADLNNRRCLNDRNRFCRNSCANYMKGYCYGATHIQHENGGWYINTTVIEGIGKNE